MALFREFLRQTTGTSLQRLTAYAQVPLKRDCSSVVNIEAPPQPDELFKRLNLEFQGHDKAVLKSFAQAMTTAANHLGITVGEVVASKRPTMHRMTLLKSVHIYKKHKVQYEVRTHRTQMALHHVTGSTADTYLEYLERFLPEGVHLKVTKVGLEKLPTYLKKE